MIWKSDDNGDKQGAVLRARVARARRRSRDGGRIPELLRCRVPSSWSEQQRIAADNQPPVLTQDDVYKDSSIDTFRTMAHVRKQLVASNLVGVAFTRTDGADITRPVARLRAEVQQG
jgi:hypothetical protein